MLDVQMVKLFEKFIGLDQRFKVVAQRRFMLVCFQQQVGYGECI